MANIAETLKRAYAEMDANGFFPVRPCAQCGEPLSGELGPRPAETYAGTYTGLCYRCERSGPYPVAELPDGTLRLSYPPHCPSWRRAREEFWAHPDCPDCGGAGRTIISRSDAQGGSYPSYCKRCHERVWSVQRSNERDYMGAVRDLFAAETLDGDPVPTCAAALVACADRALAIYANELDSYKPSRHAALYGAQYGLKPADVKLKRARTLQARIVAALDRELVKRDVA